MRRLKYCFTELSDWVQFERDRSARSVKSFRLGVSVCRIFYGLKDSVDYLAQEKVTNAKYL